jgi:flagellar biosynthetic protein FliR
MVEVKITDQITIIAFWLGFIRWSATLFQLPLFDSIGVPEILKVIFSLVMAYAFFPYTEKYILQDMIYIGIDHFWVLTILYTLIAFFGIFNKTYYECIHYVRGTNHSEYR